MDSGRGCHAHLMGRNGSIRGGSVTQQVMAGITLDQPQMRTRQTLDISEASNTKVLARQSTAANRAQTGPYQ
jgi:hypothetical protein